LPVASALLLRAFLRSQVHGSAVEHRLKSLVAGNILVFAFLCSIVLLAGEVYYRFLYDTTDSFGLTKTTQKWLARHYQINEAGVRDSLKVYPPDVRAGRRRIVFVGDSFTAGHGVADVEKRFANVIRNRRPDWEVFVQAINGADTGAEIDNLKSSIAAGYAVDVVVLVYCLNDISDLIPEWQETLQRLFSHHPPWLFAESYFLNQLYFRAYVIRYPDVGNYYHCVVDAYRGAAWDAQQRRLRELANVVASANGRLVVVTFPFLNALGRYDEFRPIHSQLDRFWESEGVRHLDLLDTFVTIPSSELMVSPSDPHPNERAHALAADAIERFLDRAVAK
jgi:lysophospholipase L1-like esterase